MMVAGDNNEMESHGSETDFTIPSDVEHDEEAVIVSSGVVLPTKKAIAGDSAESIHRRSPKRMMMVVCMVLALVVMSSWIPIVARNQKSRSGQQHSVTAEENDTKEEDTATTSSSGDDVEEVPSVEGVDTAVEPTTPETNSEVLHEWVDCINDDTGFTPINAIYWSELGKLGDSKSPVARTFDVTPMHHVVENGSSSSVVFAVETVAAPLSEHVQQPLMSYEDILYRRQMEAANFYRLFDDMEDDDDVLVEVMSVPDRLIYAGGHGFVAAAMMAFAYHLPLALSPDDLWMVISNGFARHVQQNAEELRDSFVNFEGKKKIRIREDALVKNPHNPDEEAFGSSPVVWQDKVFPKFSKAIANYTDQVNPDVHTTLVQDFTTSSPASRAASEITLMATMSAYFEFEMETMCGIPQIRLDGSRQDWESLRLRTQKLADWMVHDDDDNSKDWIPTVVIPILDEFIKTYDGHVNHCFWQNMVKFRETGNDSGSYDFLSGWLPTLFPYLIVDDQLISNPNLLRHWTEAAKGDMKGPRPNEIPLMVSSVPVLWEYFKVEYKMHFHAGFSGVVQEAADGTVKPSIGWYVTEDPPSDD